MYRFLGTKINFSFQKSDTNVIIKIKFYIVNDKNFSIKILYNNISQFHQIRVLHSPCRAWLKPCAKVSGREISGIVICI